MMNPMEAQLNSGTLSLGENQIERLRREYANPTGDKKRLKEVAQEFEAVFFQQLLDAMDKTIDRENSLFNGGYGEKVFRGMLNQHIATTTVQNAAGSGFGMAETIYQQMAQVMDSQEKARQALQVQQTEQGVQHNATPQTSVDKEG